MRRLAKPRLALGAVPETEAVDLTRDPRRRLALVVAGVTVLVLVGSLLVIAAVRGLLPGTADCTVTAGKRSVDLTEDEAQAAATVSARAVRLRLPLRTTSVAVADPLDSSERDARLVAAALTGRSRHALTCTRGARRRRSRTASTDRG
jgi:hypothetical protein